MKPTMLCVLSLLVVRPMHAKFLLIHLMNILEARNINRDQMQVSSNFPQQDYHEYFHIDGEPNEKFYLHNYDGQELSGSSKTDRF